MSKRTAKIAQQKDKALQRQIKRWRARIYRELNKSILPAIEIAKNNPTEQGARYAAQSIKTQEIYETLQKANADVIETAADYEFSYLGGQKSKRIEYLKKEDPIAFPASGYGEFTAEQILWLQQIQTWNSSVLADVMKSINSTSESIAYNTINKIILQAQAEGLSVFETSKLIETQVKKEWRRQSKFRADRIARTELHRASQYGAQEGALATGLDLNKQWLTFLDGRERPAHAEANGQTVDMRGFFNVGGEQMSVPGRGGSAANTVNCRCQVVHVPKNVD